MAARTVPAWLLVALAAALPRIWIAANDWQRYQEFWRDNVYIRAAENYYRDGLFTGGLALRPVERQLAGEKTYYTNHPPLYPLSVSAAFMVLGEHHWAARLPELFASFFVLMLLWSLAKRSDEDLSEVSLLVAAMLALSPGLVWYSVSGDAVGTPALFGQVFVVWMYLAYRHGISPAGGILFAASVAVALLIDWLTLFASIVCILHLYFDRDRPPRGRSIAGLAVLTSAGVFLFVVLVYMAPYGGLTGVVSLVRGLVIHAAPAAWADGGALWSGAISIFGDWRWMTMLPVMVLGLWELVFQPEDPRPNGLRTVSRLLLVTALLQTGIYFFGSLRAHAYLSLPLVTVLTFAGGVKLARFRNPLVSWTAAAVIMGAGYLGLEGRLAETDKFYAPRLALYEEISEKIRTRSESYPSSQTVVIGTNAWVPRGSELYIAPNVRLVQVSDPALIPYLDLDDYLAVNPPGGRDLTPVPYEQLSPAAFMEAAGARPWTAGEMTRWIPLPQIETGSEIPPDSGGELSVSVSANRGLRIDFSPSANLAETVFRIFDRVYRGDDLLREGGRWLHIEPSGSGLSVIYQERFPGETAHLELYRHYPRVAGAFRESAIRVYFSALDGQKALFDCPLPGPEAISCRKRS